MMPNFEYTHNAEKARDTTLDDKIFLSQRIKMCRTCDTSLKLARRTSVTTSHGTCSLMLH